MWSMTVKTALGLSPLPCTMLEQLVSYTQAEESTYQLNVMSGICKAEENGGHYIHTDALHTGTVQAKQQYTDI